jgi:cyclophilin family peptidyl-prolyl cis-trans isomerase
VHSGSGHFTCPLSGNRLPFAAHANPASSLVWTDDSEDGDVFVLDARAEAELRSACPGREDRFESPMGAGTYAAADVAPMSGDSAGCRRVVVGKLWHLSAGRGSDAPGDKRARAGDADGGEDPGSGKKPRGAADGAADGSSADGSAVTKATKRPATGSTGSANAAAARTSALLRLVTTAGQLSLELAADAFPEAASALIAACRARELDGARVRVVAKGFAVSIDAASASGSSRGGTRKSPPTWAREPLARGAIAAPTRGGRHDARGVVSVDRGDPASGIFITLGAQPALDNRRVAFGRVVGGKATLDALEANPPGARVTVTESVIFRDPFE